MTSAAATEPRGEPAGRPFCLQGDAAVPGDGGRGRAAVLPAADQSGPGLSARGRRARTLRPRLDRPESAMAQRAGDQCRGDRPHRRLWRRCAHVHDGARAVVPTIASHAPSGVRARPRAGRRDDAHSGRGGLASRLRSALGACDRGGAVDVLDRDRHSDAGREQTASFQRWAGEFGGALVSGSGGRAAPGDDRRILGRGRARTGMGASQHARPGGDWGWAR